MKAHERIALDSSAVILYFRGQAAARDEHFDFIEGLEVIGL